MFITRILNEVRPLFHLLEEPLTRAPSVYAHPLHRLMEDPFLRSSFGRHGALSGRPAVDVIEEGDKYVVAADLPGVKKENVEVRVGEDGRSLTIEGRIIQQGETSSTPSSRGETTNQISKERFYSINSQFERIIWLPRRIDVESMSAKLQDGVLRVTASKAEDETSKVVRIE
ncbi:hypothetical protein AX15_000069 [Amanita polypyramis BW_CC]|nr:hypothetical protein AX15_000069 [Amanita polypyramis BW_CC]